MTTILQVALGGALGATARHMAGAALLRIAGSGFPWGTLFVNVLGSFLMGVLVVTFARHGGTRISPLIVTGLLGGFTTFSTFSLDTANLVERGQIGLAASYVGASLALSLAAIAVGLSLARVLL